MDVARLNETAKALVAEGKGILAADESTGTIKKRFDSIGVESTEEHRRAYRDLLFTTEGAADYISGVILYDETIRQNAARRDAVPRGCSRPGDHPRDQGRHGREAARARRGRDGHRGPRRAARAAGRVPRARRALRQVARDVLDRRRHSRASTASGRTRTRSRATPRSARRPDIVPIVEPEVLLDGDAHDRARARRRPAACSRPSTRSCTTSASSSRGTLLKPNMVLSGYDGVRARRRGRGRRGDARRASTTTCPAAVPGIVFLSGGQTDEDATAHLNAMNARGPHPWQLSFSYGRALQAPALEGVGRRRRRTSRPRSRRTSTARA